MIEIEIDNVAAGSRSFLPGLNQRAVIVKYVLQLPLGRVNNLAMELSQRLHAFSPLPSNAAMDARWI